MLLVVAIYERNRANEIEAKSILVDSPEYREIVNQDWEIMKRELALKYAMQKYEKDKQKLTSLDDRSPEFSIGDRRELANIRNSKLKIEREKSKLESMRNALVESGLKPSSSK